MTIRGLISTLSQQEDLNFLLTNRIPRAALTRFVGWFSKIEHPLIRDLSIACWRLFSDLDLSEARKTSFTSLHDCFTRELRPGLRPPDPDTSIVVSPSDGIIGAFGAIADTELFQIKGAPYSLLDLLGDPALVAAHRNGRFITLRLTSSMYHRFHAPHDCRIEQVTFISGDTWNVNPIALKRIEKLFCKNERAVIRTRLQSGEPWCRSRPSWLRVSGCIFSISCSMPQAAGQPSFLAIPESIRVMNSGGSSTDRPSSCWRRIISSFATTSWNPRGFWPVSP